MKTIRTAALARHVAPPFVMLSGLELLKLRTLSALAFRLFVELLGLDKRNEGRIETTYAVLVALLDFDQAPGAHATCERPTLQRVRTALAALVDAQLVRVDRRANERDKGLFLRVERRSGIGASNGMSNRRSNRPKSTETRASMRPSGARAGEEQQTERQGIQDEVFPSISPTVHKPAAIPPAVRDRVAVLKQELGADGLKWPPKGGRTTRAARARPPGAAPPGSAQADPSPPNSPTNGAARPFAEAFGRTATEYGLEGGGGVFAEPEAPVPTPRGGTKRPPGATNGAG